MAVAYLEFKGIGTSRDVDRAAEFLVKICLELHYEPACEVLRHPKRGIPAPCPRLRSSGLLVVSGNLFRRILG